MAISEPQDLHTALSPLIYFNWIIGIGMLYPPKSKRIYLMMILYSVGFWVFYVVTLYIGVGVMVSSYFYDNSPMAITMYQALVYTNTCASIAAPLLAWIRYKGLKNYFERIEKLDETFVKILGFQKNYKTVVIAQIYDILMISVIILAITITDSMWLRSNTPFFRNVIIMYAFHHPILLLLVIDSNFCGSTRCLRRRFKDVNTALLALADPNVASYFLRGAVVVKEKITSASSSHGIINGEEKDSMSKRYLFNTIRKVHLELSKLAGTLNLVFGIQNLISMTVSTVMITGLLYTIYSAFYWEHAKRYILIDVMPPACWCIIYVFKIFIISYSCASVSDEAQRSGQIIYEVLGTVVDREFHKEIEEFALQMIQNPVRFTASGFFTLDYTFVQGVIGSITTYLVILIQMSNTTSSTSISSVNKTTT